MIAQTMTYLDDLLLHNTLKTSGLNLTQIEFNRNPDPGQYATDANRVKLTQTPGSTYLTQNSGSMFLPRIRVNFDI